MRLSDQRGQETLQAIFAVAFILIPVLFSTLEIGNVLHLWIGQHPAPAESARIAGAMGEDDLAVRDRIDAVTEVDANHYAATGELLLDTASQAVYRAYLVPNLAPLRGQMGGGATPESVAQNAELAVVNSVPANNPFNGHRLDRPAVCARIRGPIRTGLLSLAGLAATPTLTITWDAEIRGELRWQI